MKLNEMSSIELMEWLKGAIQEYKYGRITYEEFIQLEDDIEEGIAILVQKCGLLALPFKLKMGIK